MMMMTEQVPLAEQIEFIRTFCDASVQSPYLRAVLVSLSDLTAANERIARLEGVATAALRRARAALSVAIRAAVEDIDFDPQEHHAIKDIDAALATLSPAGTVTPPNNEPGLPTNPAVATPYDELRNALQAAIKVADEARDEWDAAPGGMRAGKLLIALSGHLKGYRADIDAIHAALAKAASPTGPVGGADFIIKHPAQKRG